jgi:hypothetical protein
LIDRFNVAPLLNAPVETITQGLLLQYKPLNLDVLPLYVVLMGAEVVSALCSKLSTRTTRQIWHPIASCISPS